MSKPRHPLYSRWRNGSKLNCADRADVPEALNAGPVLREDLPAEFVALDLPERRTESGPLEPELKPADS